MKRFIKIHLIVGLTKKTLYKKSQYFPKPYRSFGENSNVKIDLSNYAIKTDSKNTAGFDTSNFALKSNLASLKTEVGNLDIDKLVTTPLGLSKLIDVVKNYVFKRAVYEKLVEKVNNIDISAFFLKIKYDTGKSELEKKIPDARGLVKKTGYSAKITETENKIPSISGLATNTVENKIPNVSSLVKKTDYDTKISETEKELTNHNHDKYITNSEFNKFTAEVFDAGLT